MSKSPSLQTILHDRADAGRRLVEPLLEYAHRPDVIVLALPRGGVPVAYEVARALDIRLDLMLVRKLGVPTREEFAMGAIASGGIQILNEDALRAHPVDQARFNAVVTRETQELLRREQVYREGRPPLQLKDQVVILIDDGLATGASMMAAVHAVRAQAPARIVVAVPVAPLETAEALRSEVDELVCPLTPEWMMSIGYWYLDFSQTSDTEVIDLLQRAWQRESVPGPSAQEPRDV
ncbi:phosphoribosyltransferase [Pseudomonas chlororaphis]|uniref:Phosphoribosyl transferase domain protein n=1 Tax=Pseudomonas chlororaphis subsp. aureofaciens TaxID=587851 RepID=A0AAD0ZJD3_9PSED|nr:phosphoribosyltransferase [Pseudomonas chlororaphis]AZE23580.1 Phosphoribosyl transferase domain protein [Pseudomonas chlororaphis subsp. aureofaciens]AZE29875.1 Phosphoribosyl transferase domain protein [Pseudomonas chlororaphis subsp. aureofaciens]AZE36179.1 Phosphoribosyl transferase domain protein [Pseudomonas chlororaphis subsp. aureofaciens]AZE42523.1 Phosphoribosyl transferase domain protein [Pseudomonas chlororaphis subsp. aureofaciens]KAA5833855.1 phosphoribosyltransferase [Pseudom